MRPFLFLIAFGAAIWALGDGWEALRETWAAPTAAGAASVLAYLAVFALAFLYIGFTIYTADRMAGRVRRPIRLYERILSRRAGGRGDGKALVDDA